MSAVGNGKPEITFNYTGNVYVAPISDGAGAGLMP